MHRQAIMDNPATPSKALPADGMSRWKQIEPFSPFSREKFRQLVIAGKAPQPVKFSERCTAYPIPESLDWFKLEWQALQPKPSKTPPAAPAERMKNNKPPLR